MPLQANSSTHQMTATTHSGPDRSSRGIDIRQALSILSARSDSSENRPEGPDGRIDGCGCCHGGEVPEHAKSMGQTIDMMLPGDADDSDKAGQPSADMQEEQDRLKQERAERMVEIHDELRSMSSQELLKAVLKAQQERVATYREYEKGLEVVLQTGNVTSYPDTCAKATAAFSVLSETIKVIQEILQSERQRKDLYQIIQQLQKHEQEKLHLTAAHHLERIRQKDQLAQTQPDPRIESLLHQGVQFLKAKIDDCVEHINEVLDEIRCSILEEEE